METANYKHGRKKEVFFVESESRPIYHKCYTCLGEGQLKRIDDTYIPCPVCKGEKEVTTGGGIDQIVKSGIIKSIKIFIGKYDKDVVYYLKDKENVFNEFQLFDTEEEAEKSIMKGVITGYSS